MTDVSPVLVSRITSRIISRGAGRGIAEVERAMRDLGLVVTDDSLRRIVVELRRNFDGWGALEPLRWRPGVTDVLVNGAEKVYIDCGAGLEQVELALRDETEVRQLASRLAASAGRRLDDASPMVDALLPDGTRFHSVLSPIALPGTSISLRLPRAMSMPLDDWVIGGGVSPRMAELLRRIVSQRIPFLVSGGTGSGKTTLLSSLLAFVSNQERIIICEDSRELDPPHPHCLRLESRPTNVEGSGQVGLRDLVRHALRMRPDRLIVGEVRGGELSDLLTAFNTGHRGGCATIHANRVEDLPARFEALAALGGMAPSTVRLQALAAFQLAVHVAAIKPGVRGVDHLGVLVGTRERIRFIRCCDVSDSRIIPREGWPELERLLSL